MPTAPDSSTGPGAMANGSDPARAGSPSPTEAGPGPAMTCWSPSIPVEASSSSSLPTTPRAARPTTIETTTTTASTATLDIGRHQGSVGRARGTKGVVGQGSGSSIGRATGGGALADSGSPVLDGTTSVDLFNRFGSGRSTMSPVRVGSSHSTESLGADAMGLSGRCGCPWRVWTEVRVGAASQKCNKRHGGCEAGPTTQRAGPRRDRLGTASGLVDPDPTPTGAGQISGA